MSKPAVVNNYYDYDVYFDLGGNMKVRVKHGVDEVWTEALVYDEDLINLGDGEPRTEIEFITSDTLTTFVDGTFDVGFASNYLWDETIEAIGRVVRLAEL